jgi:hypothetical protein
MKRSISFLPLLGPALLAVSGPSAGGDHGKGWDYKTLPGATCQPALVLEAADIVRSPIGISNNNPRDQRTVLCPIVRDTVNEYDLDIGVTVSRGVSCQFFVMNYKGVYAPGTPHSPSSNAMIDTGKEIQYFSVKADSSVDPSGFVGYYALACTLSPGGIVYSYGSGENADTTDYGE